MVISAAGSIHSPALLLRSGITCGGNVGTNLRLHPCTVVVGVFPEDQSAGAGQGRPGCRVGGAWWLQWLIDRVIERNSGRSLRC